MLGSRGNSLMMYHVDGGSGVQIGAQPAGAAAPAGRGNAVTNPRYIGAAFGPGPRDGLMTGLVRRTGGSVRLVRTTIEIAVVLTGWALGGTLGIATVLYALTIGPLVQLFLPHLTVHPDGSSPQTGRRWTRFWPTRRCSRR